MSEVYETEVYDIIWSNPSDFPSLESVDRDSEPQL